MRRENTLILMRVAALALLLFVAMPDRMYAQTLLPSTASVDSLETALKTATGRDRAVLLSELSRALTESDYDRALAMMGDARNAALDAADSSLAAEYALVQGQYGYGRGNYEPALKAYQEGLRLADAVGDRVLQARVLNEIGTLVKKQGDLDTSQEYFEDALARSREANDAFQTANSLNNLGIVYDNRGEFEQALELFEESAAMKEAMGDLDGLTYNLDNMGITTARMGQFEASEGYFRRSAELREQLGDFRGYGVIMGNLAELMLMKGDRNAALSYLETAIESAYETEYHDFRRHLYGVRSSIYRDTGDFEQALVAYEAMTVLKDSLFNEERSRQLQELQTQYETEQKEQTIALQAADLAERAAQLQRNYVLIALLLLVVSLLAVLVYWRRTREELRIKQAQMRASIASQEEERKRIARDLHDGLGQLISSVRLQAAESSNSTLDDMHAEIRNISFNLMPETLLRQGVTAAVQELGYRMTAEGFFEVEVSAFDVTRPKEAVEVGLFRMVQEWLNNVSKYAGATHVNIQFVQHDDELVVMIEDDGAGFNTSRLTRNAGHGWMNMTSRVQAMDGILHVDSQEGRPGTTVVIRIPVAARVVAAGV